MRPGTADLRPLPRRVFRSFLAHRLGPMLPGSGDHPVDRLLVAGHPYHVVRAETNQTERSDVSSVAAVDTDDQTASARHHAELGDGHADQHRALAYRKLVHCHIFAVDRRQRHLDRTGDLLQLLVRTDDGNPVGRHENGLGMRSIDTVTAPQDRNDRHAVAQTQVQLSEAAAYQRTVARHGQPGQMQMLRLRIGRTDDRAEFLLVQIGEEPLLEDFENQQLKQQLSPALTYMITNYEKSISAADMAKLCNLSYSYFSRSFNRLLHMNFSDYLNEIRIREAEKLLVSTTQNVTEIASAVGFCTTSYFIKQFTKYLHISPKQYQKQMRQGTERFHCITTQHKL